MPVFLVQLGSPRLPAEGVRIGTVPQPPRGVAPRDWARLHHFDVWYPELAPSARCWSHGQAAQMAQDPRMWQQFVKDFRTELARPSASRTLALLAALSHHASFSLGCYCPTEHYCHRQVLRSVLQSHGAALVPAVGGALHAQSSVAGLPSSMGSETTSFWPEV